MRKIKRILPFILAICMVFSLCFSLACSTGNGKELQSLELDTSNAKVDFSLGEEYSSKGLVVTAIYKSGNKATINTSEVTIDKGSYDAYTKGTYEITVSYSSEGTSASATYNVNVVDALFGGLVVTLKTGRQSKYTLSASNNRVNFTNAATWIEVRKPDENGEADMNAPALDRSLYTVKIYKGADEVEDLSAVNRGIYQIWASVYDEKEDFTYEGFTLITVFDDIKSIAFKEGTTQQAKGLREVMTPTWKFTVTYNSGDTEVVDKTNNCLKISSINPNVAANNGTATVTYQEPETNVRTVDVNYTLTGEQSNPDLAIFNLTGYDAGDVTNLTIDSEHAEFTVVGGKIITNKSAQIVLPTGISVNGATTLSVGTAYQSAGASSATAGRYIYFSADRDFEIYIYGQSNSDEDRTMYLETESDYAAYSLIDGYLDINNMPLAYKSASAPSVHALSVAGLSAENPADFTLSFDASVNIFYILIIFPEDIQQ